MTSALFGMLAETAVHPGTDSSTGLIDLPVAREAATGYPLLPSSSLKGALKNKAEKHLPKDEVEHLFGEPDNAGSIAVTDARLLLLPVRSLTTHYVWVTCPYILNRLCRDLKLVGKTVSLSVEMPPENKVFAHQAGKLFLEELTFQAEARPDLIAGIAEIISPLIFHESVRNSLINQLVIVSDDRMNYFATYCLSVRARNKLDPIKKTSASLWYEETLPPDTVMYFATLQLPNSQEGVAKLESLFATDPYLQAGGNETMGQGWFVISKFEGGKQ